MKTVTALSLALTGTMAVGAVLGQSTPAAAPALSDPGVLQVAMLERGPTDMRFEPEDKDLQELVVTQGDTLRFIQRGNQPHNVEFVEWPEGADLGDVRMGPFLIGKGETYEIVIDQRFLPGSYDFVCTPHVPMGMVGSLTVVADEAGRE